MVHELSHELMHWKKTSPFYDEANIQVNNTRALKELQAESVSYIVLKHYDLEVSHHPTYLALWRANKDKIQTNVKIISSVARFIIERLDEIAKGDSNLENETAN